MAVMGKIVKATDYGEVAFLSLYKRNSRKACWKKLKLKQRKVTAQAVQVLYTDGGRR